MIQLPSLPEIRAILEEASTIAVVGLSPKPARPSNQVARYLLAAGYTVIPVNPGQTVILDQPCYPDLAAIGRPVDIVDIFRRADQVEAIVRQAIAISARVVWMQQGIVNEEAGQLAREAGLQVVMDRCLKVEHQRLFGQATPL